MNKVEEDTAQCVVEAALLLGGGAFGSSFHYDLENIHIRRLPGLLHNTAGPEDD